MIPNAGEDVEQLELSFIFQLIFHLKKKYEYLDHMIMETESHRVCPPKTGAIGHMVEQIFLSLMD